GRRWEKGEDLSLFMDIIKTFPVIFNKSMLPESRQKKSAALANIREKYEKGFGVPITEAQLIKKVSNMKTRLKKKTDLKKTGNKTIKLNDWERKLYELMEGEMNPVINRAEGDEDEPETSASTCTNTTVPQPPPRRRSSPTILHQKETEETRHLSLTDLQRLVLVEQLAALKEQRAYYKEKSERLSGNYQNTSDNAQNIDNTSLFASYTQM
ncbi:hypothetical protein ANN_19187, partial [Periplaneta americana]